MVTKRNSEWTVYLTLDSELAVVTGDGAGVGITYSRSQDLCIVKSWQQYKMNVYFPNNLLFYDMMAIDRIYFTISLLRPIFGAPALAMTLKLTLDTNTMGQIIAKRDAGRKCEYMKFMCCGVSVHCSGG